MERCFEIRRSFLKQNLLITTMTTLRQQSVQVVGSLNGSVQSDNTDATTVIRQVVYEVVHEVLQQVSLNVQKLVVVTLPSCVCV